MKPTEQARQHIALLLQFGVAQKVIAGKMEVSEATFSRWYHHRADSKGKPAKIPAESLDRLEEYVEQFAGAFTKEPQRPAEATGTAGRLQRSGGDDEPHRPNVKR